MPVHTLTPPPGMALGMIQGCSPSQIYFLFVRSSNVHLWGTYNIPEHVLSDENTRMDKTDTVLPPRSLCFNGGYYGLNCIPPKSVC